MAFSSSIMSSISANVILLLLASLVALANAAAPPFTNNTAVAWTPSSSDKSQSTCGTSSFALDSNITPADWRHCVALSSEWTGDHGVFVVKEKAGDAFVPVLISGECTLAVRGVDAGNGRKYHVGDADIGKILDKSLKDYSEGTDLAVHGEVKCDVEDGERAGLQWRIFDSTV